MQYCILITEYEKQDKQQTQDLWDRQSTDQLQHLQYWGSVVLGLVPLCYWCQMRVLRESHENHAYCQRKRLAEFSAVKFHLFCLDIRVINVLLKCDSHLFRVCLHFCQFLKSICFKCIGFVSSKSCDAFCECSGSPTAAPSVREINSGWWHYRSHHLMHLDKHTSLLLLCQQLKISS